jgi:hypothetical protein
LCLLSVALGVPAQINGNGLAAKGSAGVASFSMAVSEHGGSHIRRESKGKVEMPISKHTAVVEAEAEHKVLSLADVAHKRKPEGPNITGHPPTLTKEEAEDRLVDDGLVQTFNAADDESNVIKLEEETMECMMDTPVWECMEKHGSYGVRRLYTDSIDDFNSLDNWRKDWMAHPEVQRKKLFEVTWPATHDSGAYSFDPSADPSENGKASVKGAITQHLDVFTQLSVGVRALEMQIAVNKKDGNMYTANGFLMMPLSTVLTDVASFLETHHKEVVLLYMRKADVYNGIEAEHVQHFKDEETNPEKIPGESVHKGVQAIIGHHLATYKSLTSLPPQENLENPHMDAAIAAGVRVFYFWEGQQVLCITKAECETIPGWDRGTLGEPFAFGPGMAPGARTNLNAGTETKTYIEPGCIHSSASQTQSSNPIQLLLNVKKYAGALMDATHSHPAACYPAGASAPPVKTPTILYEADLWPSPFTETEGAYRHTYQDIKEIYTRGEGATLKSEAERVNYLALNWFLRKNWQPLFSKLSIIAMDYVAPINVHRIVEANQAREDCGYAIYCKTTGSCWAQTLLDSEANACKNERVVLAFLKWHAAGRPWPLIMLIFFIIFAGLLFKMCCVGSICHFCGNNCMPSCNIPGGSGIVWWKRKPKPAEAHTVFEEPQEEEAEAEPEQQDMNDGAEVGQF